MNMSIILFWEPIVDDIDIEPHSFSILVVALALSSFYGTNRFNYLPESPASHLSNFHSQHL